MAPTTETPDLRLRSAAAAAPDARRALTVADLFERQAARRPRHIAVRDGIHTLTYAGLDARANQLSRYLQSLGAGPETLVGICLDRSVDLPVALLAAMKAGAGYVPLDPAFPRDRLAYMVEDASLHLLITQRSLECVACRALPQDRVVRLDADAPAIASCSAEAVHSHAGTRNIAYVLYTSGSTGRPKGVQIEHRGLTNCLLSLQREPGCTEEDRLLAVTTLSFDIAAVELYLPLISGGLVVIASRDEAADPVRLARLMRHTRPTIMQATPATWRMLIDSGWDGSADLTAFCGGETMHRDLADRLLDRAREVWNLYGPTETTIWSTLERVARGTERVGIGHPIANTTVYVLDEQLQPVPPDGTGELFIGGDGVARGYLNRPDLTRERFLCDAFSGRPGDRLYRTGDRARLRADGTLECLGRSDAQVKVRGYRIELGEIEAALSAHPSVREAAACARDDDDGQARLVAYVAVRSGHELSPAQLRSFLGVHLPAYMVPSLFVGLQALPKTPNGKIDRNNLPNPKHVPAWARRPSANAATQRSADESALAAIWSDVLDVPEIGLDEDFFDLGGHSLLAVRLMASVRDRFQVDLPLSALFEARTVREFAVLLRSRGAATGSRILVPIRPTGSKLPFFCVHGLGGEVLAFSALASRLDAERPFYAISAPGHHGEREPLTSIEQMADAYVDVLRTAHPHGPYLLGGYSMGGSIAVEMARRLRAAGAEVAFVGVLDGPPPHRCRPGTQRLLAFAGNVPRWVRHDLLRGDAHEQAARLRRYPRRMAKTVAAALRPDADGAAIQVGDIVDVSQLPDTIRRIYAFHFDAFQRYRPSPYPGHVTVFRADGQPLFGCHERDLGWHSVARSVSVRPVSGNHKNMLDEPQVTALARELGDALDRALEDSE